MKDKPIQPNAVYRICDSIRAVEKILPELGNEYHPTIKALMDVAKEADAYADLLSSYADELNKTLDGYRVAFRDAMSGQIAPRY